MGDAIPASIPTDLKLRHYQRPGDVMTINLTPRKCLGYRSRVEAFLSELGRDVEIRFA